MAAESTRAMAAEYRVKIYSRYCCLHFLKFFRGNL